MPPPSSSLLDSSLQDNTLQLTLRGEWDIRHQPPSMDMLETHFEDSISPSTVTFNTQELGMFDSSLISLLLKLHKRCEEKGVTFARNSLPEGINQLLDMALAVPEKRDARAGTTERRFFTRIGEASIQMVDELLDLNAFLGECLLSMGRFLRGKARFRRKEFWMILQDCGIEALPIVSLIGLLIGMIFAFVGAYQMEMMGATVYVASLVSLAMVREMGCLMTGVIMSGRTGAAFAAQLGSMKVNEEIDALKTFSFSPIDFLVLPRMLALILMMPLLTIYAIIIGIIGGALVTVLGYGVSLQVYISYTLDILTFESVALGIGKSVIFGIIVAGAGCLRGIQSGSSASAVGTAATSAVVISITAIIITDCIFAVITTILGI